MPARRSSSDPGGRPRIAVVAPTLDILGGQGVQARALVACLREDGYPVDFVPINPAFPAGLRWLRRLRFLRTPVNQALYLPRLLSLKRADVVHVFSASYWSFLLSPVPAMFAARLFRKRVILHYHSGEAADHLARWGALVHPFLRLADEIVVPSPYLQRVFAGFGYRVKVIRNLIDAGRFHYRDRRRPRPRLLSMRNLEPHYRVDVVLHAFALLKKRYPEATLVVAGYGSQEWKLRRLAAALGLDGVRFAGRIEQDAVPGLYDAADILVNAADVDNQPVTILEAFAAGVPVVSTDVGDIGSMLRDGTAGVVVPRGDARSLADAVAALVDNPMDALTMTRCAREELERYSWPGVAADWADIYRGLDAA